MPEGSAVTTLLYTKGLEDALEKFVAERGWTRSRSPKNLTMALTAEVGELVEIFQWLSEDESKHVMREPELSRQVQQELADVLIYLVRLASVLGVDLDTAVRDKLAKNAEKYPLGNST